MMLPCHRLNIEKYQSALVLKRRTGMYINVVIVEEDLFQNNVYNIIWQVMMIIHRHVE